MRSPEVSFFAETTSADSVDSIPFGFLSTGISKLMFKLLGMLLGGGAIPREAARARSNNGCWPELLGIAIGIILGVIVTLAVQACRGM